MACCCLKVEYLTAITSSNISGPDLKHLNNKNMAIRAIVVGGTSGIGFGMACRVAAELKPATVIISGRTRPQNIPHANMEFRRLDALSMCSIKQYTDKIKSELDGKLDYLIMTQGIMTIAGRTETPEGIDRKMALHYYGKQLLIRELMPALKEDAKVIVVLDGIFGNAAKLDWKDLDLKRTYSIGNSAQHCMVMNDAMIQFYAAEQKRQGTGARHFVHAFPGAVKSNLARELPWYLSPLLGVAGSLVGVSVDTCAERLLSGTAKCATEGKTEGRFWSNIDSKGKLSSKKTVFTEDQMKKIADHTWDVVDKAIESSPN